MRHTSFLRTVSLLGSLLLAGGMAAYSSQAPQVKIQPAVYQVEAEPAVAAEPAPVTNVAQPDGFLPPVGGGAAGGVGIGGRSHRVRLAPDGFLPGRVVLLSAQDPAGAPVRDVAVYFVQNRQVVATAQSGEGGVFQAKVAPGVYSVVAMNSQAYTAFVVHVVSADAPAAAGVGENLEIDAAAVPAGDFPVISDLLAQMHGLSSGAAFGGGGAGAPGMPLGPGGGGAGGLEKATTLYTHDVLLQGGGVSGRLVRLDPQTGAIIPASSAEVYFIQNNQIVSQTTSGPDGGFTVTNVGPGVYTVATMSRGSGFAALSVRVVDGGNAAAVESGVTVKNVSATTMAGGSLEVGMLNISDIFPGGGVPPLVPPGEFGQPPFMPPFAQGPMGMGMGPGGMGGGWGPGGGFGDGLGLWSLLPLAALPFLDDDDDSDGGSFPPATTFAP